MRRATMIACCILLATCAWPQSFIVEDFSEDAEIEDRRGFSVLREAEFSIANGVATFRNPEGMGSTVLIPIDPALHQESEAWDECNGIALILRGDGSEQFSRVAFGDGGYMYELYFPLANDEWHELRVHFSELVGVGALYPIGSPGMLPPSGIRTIQLGDRWHISWNNSPMPEHSFEIASVRLISDAAEPPPAPSPRPIEEVLRKLRDREPVTIQCMGDSITAGTGLPDRDSQRYAVLLGEVLRERFGYDEIETYSRAVGGARTPHVRHWTPRDFHGVEPDLVAIAIGYNDKSGAYEPGFYRWSLNDYIDRIARETEGQAAISPITALPGGYHRFVMMDDFAQAVRDLARERGDVTAIDLAAQIKPMGRQGWMQYLGDMAHPNIEGHEWIANAIANWLVERVEAL